VRLADKQLKTAREALAQARQKLAEAEEDESKPAAVEQALAVLTLAEKAVGSAEGATVGVAGAHRGGSRQVSAAPGGRRWRTAPQSGARRNGGRHSPSGRKPRPRRDGVAPGGDRQAGGRREETQRRPRRRGRRAQESRSARPTPTRAARGAEDARIQHGNRGVAQQAVPDHQYGPPHGPRPLADGPAPPPHGPRRRQRHLGAPTSARRSSPPSSTSAARAPPRRIRPCSITSRSN